MSAYVKRSLTPSFGLEISGIDLSEAITDDVFSKLRQDFAESGVLLIRNQGHISPLDQVEFSKRFGPLEEHVLTQFLLPGHPEIFVVSNITENGRYIGAHGGAKEYHSDLAYLQEPSLGSVFRCLECPEEGGETAFVSMAAAYDALPKRLQLMFDELDAVYDYVWSYDRRMASIRGPLSEIQRAKTPPIVHPAVRAHPETGRKALFLSDIWVRYFVGMNEADSQDLLAEVMEIAKKPEAEYQHVWKPGDIVMWDNRSTMHRACPFDEENTRRLMHRTTIKGDKPLRSLTGH
ncbi:MAG: TauD/TfdA family dioxygenase [Rhodospirillales bacterium]